MNSNFKNRNVTIKPKIAKKHIIISSFVNLLNNVFLVLFFTGLTSLYSIYSIIILFLTFTFALLLFIVEKLDGTKKFL